MTLQAGSTEAMRSKRRSQQDENTLTQDASDKGRGRGCSKPACSVRWRCQPGAISAEDLADLSRRAAVYATRARGEGTRRAYRAAWAGFCQWCESLGREPLAGDPDTIAMFLVRRADDGCAVSTLRVGLAAIRTAHLLAGVPLDLRHPALSMVLEGITRSKGVRPRRQATPAVPDLLRRLLATRPTVGKSDRRQGPGDAAAGFRRRAAPLGTGRADAGRRHRGAGPRRAAAHPPLEDRPAGQGRSRRRRRQPGRSRLLPGRRAAGLAAPPSSAPPTSPPSAGPAGPTTGPLFCAVTKGGTVTGTGLSDKAVVRLIKQAAEDAGLDPSRFAGHSLRAGLATAAGDAGAGLPELMRQTRHKSTEVALGYLRPAELWTNNVSARVFAAAGPAQEDV